MKYLLASKFEQKIIVKCKDTVQFSHKKNLAVSVIVDAS